MSKSTCKITAMSLALAVASSVHGNEQPATLKTAAEKAANSAQPHSSSVRFEGTDLLIGNLPPITFHGFASQGFLLSEQYNYLGDTTDGSFEFSEFGLNASMSPFPRTRIAAQAFMFDVGNVGEYTPALDYALVDYNFRDELGLRVGRIRRPQGIYNNIQDIDLARTWVLLPQGVYDARWRDFSGAIDGGSLYGNIGLGKGGSLSYEVYGGAVQLSDNGGVARMLQATLPSSGGRLDQMTGAFASVGGQLWWNTPVSGLRAGFGSVYDIDFNYDFSQQTPYGPMPIHGSINAPFQQLSLDYQWKSWTFQAEYRFQTYDMDMTSGGRPLSHSSTDGDSWYASAAYRVNSWLEVGTYYNEYYANVDNRDGSGNARPSDAYQKDWALSLRFDPKPWWIIKVEGHYIRGTGLLYDPAHNPVRNGDGWLMLALKTTLSF